MMAAGRAPGAVSSAVSSVPPLPARLPAAAVRGRQRYYIHYKVLASSIGLGQEAPLLDLF